MDAKKLAREAAVRFLMVLLLFLLPNASVASEDSWGDGINKVFLEQARFVERAEVALFKIEFIFPNGITSCAHEFQKIIFRRAPDDRRPTACVFGSDQRSWIFDCGLEAIGLGAYDGRWAFAVSEVRGSWVSIFRTRKQDEVLWLNLDTIDESEVHIVPLADWIKDEVGLAPLESNDLLFVANPHSMIPSEISLCSQTRIANGEPSLSQGGRDVYGFIASGRIQGDWIEGHCSSQACFSEATPVGCDDSVTREDLERIAGKKIPPCPMGWVRWRSPEGKLLVYPKPGDPDC